MKAIELREYTQKMGTWINWERTWDQFIMGDPQSTVTGIAVSWMPTLYNLKKALDARCNLFVTHEPLYMIDLDVRGEVVNGSKEAMDSISWTQATVDRFLTHRPLTKVVSYDDAWVRKKRWLDETGMVVYRCHDFWDDFPEIGIHGAWAHWLGFTEKPLATRIFYEVHGTGDITLGELTEKILQRVKSLGQEVIQVIGDPTRKVSRIAIGTGAGTDFREMYNMGADVLLLTDDGTRLWESGQWSLDSDIPVIIVNHSTSEEPGMRTLAVYIQEKFPHVPVMQIPVGCIYSTIK